MIGDDHPSEIHIVTTRDRPPKQVVRDVQSLATAGFGLSIDHRIVSVVQLDQDSLEAPAGPSAGEEVAPPPRPEPEADQVQRPLVERVVLANEGEGGSVTVALRWPDGRVTEGSAPAGATRETRASSAAAAVVEALRSVLAALQATVDVQHVSLQRIGSCDSVLVRAMFYDKGSTTPVVGSALVYDDVATAAVRALLHALNRKLSSR